MRSPKGRRRTSRGMVVIARVTAKKLKPSIPIPPDVSKTSFRSPNAQTIAIFQALVGVVGRAWTRERTSFLLCWRKHKKKAAMALT